MPDDLNEYLPVFIEETSHQLDLLERELIALELSSPPERVHALFRAAHTIKGSARSLGFIEMSDLAHAMEDVLDPLRSGDCAADTLTARALILAVDTLRAMLAEIEDNGTTTRSVSEAIANLVSVAASIDSEQNALRFGEPEPATDEPIARESARKIYELTVAFAPDCALRSVRAAMVARAADGTGSLIATSPDLDSISDDEGLFEIRLLVSSALEASQLREAVAMTDVADVNVEPWRAYRPDAATPPQIACTSFAPPTDERAGDFGAEARGAGLAPIWRGETFAPTKAIRIDSATFDRVMALAEDLVHAGAQLRSRRSNLSAANVERIALALKSELEFARRIPLERLFDRFPRMVHEVAYGLGKEVELRISGGQLRIDRFAIQTIADPLTQLLRNCVDHGIETGEERAASGKRRVGIVAIRAREENGDVIIEVEDDGAGMDPATLRRAAVAHGVITPDVAEQLDSDGSIELIFLPGFSTARTISEISGRGVGMDIVRDNLKRLGAALEIDSVAGAGTRFTIRLQSPAAHPRALLVAVGGRVCAIPTADVVESFEITSERIELAAGCEVVLQRGRTLPIIRLRTLFEPGAVTGPETPQVVVARVRNWEFGLVVDTILGEREVPIDSRPGANRRTASFAERTAFVDGDIVHVLDVAMVHEIAFAEKGLANAA